MAQTLPQEQQTSFKDKFIKQIQNYEPLVVFLFHPKEQCLQSLSELANMPDEVIQKLKKSSYLCQQFSKRVAERFDSPQFWNDQLEVHFAKALVRLNKIMYVDFSKIIKTQLLPNMLNALALFDVMKFYLEENKNSADFLFSDPTDDDFKEEIAFYNNCLSVFEPNYDQFASIYWKRFERLNPQQKLEYKLRTLQQLSQFSSALKAQTLEKHLAPFYEKLQDLEQPSLLNRLLVCKTAKSKELIQSIIGFKLIKLQDDNVVLEIKGSKINSKLINMDTIITCIENFAANPKKIHLFSSDFFIFDQDKLYMKFYITKIQKINDLLVQFKTQRNRQENFKEILKFFTNFMKILDHLINKKRIFVYQGHLSFIELQQKDTLQLLNKLMIYFKLLIKFTHKMNCLTLFQNSFIFNIENLTLLSNIIAYMEHFPFSQAKTITDDVLNIIRFITNGQDESFTKLIQSPFIPQFVKYVRRYIKQSQKITGELSCFLNANIQSMFALGFNISELPLQDLYEMKWKTLWSNTFDFQHTKTQKEREYLQRGKIKYSIVVDTKTFLEAFPGAIPYFERKLKDFDNLKKYFEHFCILRNDEYSDFILIAHAIYSMEEVTRDEDFNRQFIGLIKKYPFTLDDTEKKITNLDFSEKIGLNIQSQIMECEQTLINLLRNDKIVDKIDIQVLCETTQSQLPLNSQLANLLTTISYFNFLLIIDKERIVTKQSIRHKLQISLHLEMIQSVSLHRIVEHQAQYSRQYLKKLKSSGMSTLYTKLHSTAVVYNDILTKWISKLSLPYINEFLNNYDIFLDSLDNCTDRNHVLKTLKKGQRLLTPIAKQIGTINIFFQLYNFHKVKLIKILSNLWKQYQKESPVLGGVVMGTSYLNHVESCISKSIDPIAQFEEMHINHIRKEILNLNQALFNIKMMPYNSILLNNQKYRGELFFSNVKVSIGCSLLEVLTEQIETSVQYCLLLTDTIFNNLLESSQGQLTEIQPEKIADHQILMQSQIIHIIPQIQHSKAKDQRKTAFLQKIFDLRHNQSHRQQITQLFVKVLNHVSFYECKPSKFLWIQALFTESTDIMASQTFDGSKFNMLTSWIDKLLTTIQNIKQLPNFSSDFVKKYLKIVMYLLDKSSQEQLSFNNTLIIIEKLFPCSMVTYNADTKAFLHILLQTILKILPFIEDINSTMELPKIIHKIIKLNDPQFEPYLLEIFKVSPNFVEFTSVFNTILNQQSLLINMEADIKGYFLKKDSINQENQAFIKTKFDDFIKAFSQKYEDSKQIFSKMVKAFVRATTQEKRATKSIYLLYDKKQKFDYSQTLSSEFIHWKPSPLLLQAFRYIFQNFSYPESKNKLGCIQDIIIYNPSTLPIFTLYPVVKEGQRIPLIDYLVDLTSLSTASVNNIFDFLQFICLDHSLMVQTSTKPIFFSQYLCYRIIRQLLKKTLNSNSLLFLFYMVQLKRFNFLCQIKLNEEKESMVDQLVQLLKSNRTGFNRENSNYILIQNILSLIYQKRKQGKDVTQPKAKEQKVEKFKLIQQCLLPFYSEKSNNSLLHEQQFKQTTLQQRFSHIDKFYQQFDSFYIKQEAILQKPALSHIDQLDLAQALSNLNNIEIKENKIQYDEVLSTKLNLYHLQLAEKMYNMINFNPKRKRNDIYFVRISQAKQVIDIEQIVKENSLQELKCEQMRRAIQPELIYLQSNKQAESSISANLQLIQHQKRLQLERLIKTINSMQLLLDQEFVHFDQFKDQPFEMAKHHLQRKLLETEFDFNERSMTLEEFQSYLCSKSHQLDFLTDQRKRKKEFAESKMFSINMQRTLSSTSTNYLIDIMDQNLLNIQAIRNKFSQQRAFSQDAQIEKGQPFHFQKDVINQQPVSKIRQDLLFQMVLSLFYEYSPISSDYIQPFIQNKQNQLKFINTLIYILRNPLQNDHFPKQLHYLDDKSNAWSTKQNKENQQKQSLINKIISVIQLLEDRSFLKQATNYECLNQIQLQKRPSYEEGQESESYIPFFEILSILFSCKSEKIFDFFQQVDTLPNNLLNKLFDLLVIMNEEYNLQNTVTNYTQRRKLGARIQKESKIYSKIRPLFNNQLFIKKFRQTFPLDKRPNPLFLAQLINAPIYTIEQMKTIHLHFLNNEAQINDDILFFLNKVMAIYSDEALATAVWLGQYKAIFIKLINFLHKKEVKLEKEPIYRIFKFPHLMSYEMKSQLLQAELDEMKDSRYHNWDSEERKLYISKMKVFQSTFEKLKEKPDKYWLSNFQVVFHDQKGAELSGTGPGVNKQWYTLATKGMVNLDYGLFKKTPQNTYYFNRQSHINPRHLQYFEFIGKLFSNAILQSSHFLNPCFSRILYKQILSLPIEIEDIIAEQFEQGNFYKEISIIEDLKSNQDFQDLGITGMTFTYTDKRLIADKNYLLVKNSQKGKLELKGLSEESKLFLKEEQLKIIDPNAKDTENMSLDEVPNINLNIVNVGEIIELLPGGANIEVTFENRLKYLRLLREKIIEIIVKQTNQQYQQFIKGLKSIIDLKLLKRFTADQLRDFVEGSSHISVSNLRQHIILKEFIETDETIIWFFEVLEQLSQEDLANFIHFWTGESKILREGFKQMKMTIKKSSNYKFRVQTCYNTLTMPSYESKQRLKEIMMNGIMSIKHNEANIEEL